MSDSTPEMLETAQLAFQQFSQGLAIGEWEPFLEMLSDDFTFWFPAGPYQGLNVGKARAAEFFQAASKVFEAGLKITLERVTSNQSTVVFEIRSEGKMLGHPYRNQAAVSFDIREHQVCCYREYLGVIFQVPHQTV